MQTLTNLPNIGKVIAGNLEKAGIKTPDELQKIGSKEAFALIRLKADNTACCNMLYSLEGAVQGIPKIMLTTQTKEDLKVFLKR